MENNEIMEIEEVETAEEVEVEETTENSSKRNFKKLLIGAAIVGVAGAIVYKNRAKFEKRRIEKLRKKGYVIYAPDEVEAVEAETVEPEVEAAE